MISLKDFSSDELFLELSRRCDALLVIQYRDETDDTDSHEYWHKCNATMAFGLAVRFLLHKGVALYGKAR